MQKVGIFYGSDTGNTEAAAQLIQEELGADNATIFNVADAKGSDMEEFSNLIFGASTMGIGDIQYDFEDFLPEIEAADLNGKKVAIFGLGDQYSYPDSFVDAIGDIYEKLDGKGCQVVGHVPTDGYDYDESRGEINGQFVGLPLDEENQGDLTSERIKEWVSKIKNEFI